jgi:uncharacterized protein (DUF885 family)
MFLQRASPVLTLTAVFACAGAAAPEPGPAAPQGEERSSAADFVELPDLTTLAQGGMRDVIARWQADRRTLEEFFDLEQSPLRRARMLDLHAAWLAGLDSIDFGSLPRAQQIDWLLLRGELGHRLRELELEEQRFDEVAAALPFAEAIADLHDARRDLAPVEPQAVAQVLTDLAVELESVRERLARSDAEATEGGDEGEDGAEPVRLRPDQAKRAAEATDELRGALRDWHGFHSGYQPLFSWWVDEPWKALDEALDEHATWLREELAGIEDEDTIVGAPIGREALLAELEHAWIPYTPEELVAIADREMAWCRARMLEASAELGFGDDWKAALEHVKGLYVPPGEQTALVERMAREAEAYLIDNDLVSVPELARNTWRMEMMSPERQKVNPFFLGGDTVIVSYPTDSMSHADKLMSLRANNEHFSRAVVHHELIPGHRLQHFMQARHNTQRRSFSTPFWGEGWALYWELLLWDRGFARGPEDRIGMLFWRMHRCARIRFSLAFHLGTMTPQECVDLLVDEVGHERASAEGEVRRSFEGGYGPLYQCAYMLGGLQIRALAAELVDGGRMDLRAFHDAVLRQNSIPIELVRAALSEEPLSRELRPNWRFDEVLQR